MQQQNDQSTGTQVDHVQDIKSRMRTQGATQQITASIPLLCSTCCSLIVTQVVLIVHH
jgi:hypothetical protein